MYLIVTDCIIDITPQLLGGQTRGRDGVVLLDFSLPDSSLRPCATVRGGSLPSVCVFSEC